MARYSEHILSEFWDDFNAGSPDPIDTDQSIAEPIRRLTSLFQAPAPEAARERARLRLFSSMLDTDDNKSSANTYVDPFPAVERPPMPGDQSWQPDVRSHRIDRRWAMLSIAAAVLLLLAGIGGYFRFFRDSEQAPVIPAIVQEEESPAASTPVASPIAETEGPEVLWSGAISGNVWTFDAPYDVDFDAQGNLYVPDSGTNRIIKVSPQGELLDFIGDSSGPGQLNTPASVMVDADGNIYAGSNPGYVMKYDANGNFLLRWGGEGNGEGQL